MRNTTVGDTFIQGQDNNAEARETIMDLVLQEALRNFNITEDFGFALREPLTTLPDHYQYWMYLANNLPQLIDEHRLRSLVDQMPELSVEHLTSYREYMLAHVVLGFICMGYVWQEREEAPADVLPRTLAVPYHRVSQTLGLPLILTYADCVLANWKLRNPNGDLTAENMDLIFSFPGGESCKGFFIVSLLVELAASPGIVGVLEVMHALEKSDMEGIEKGLAKVTESLKQMKETFGFMHKHVTPKAFYGILRIFVSGWRDNPALPNGLLYEGVSDERIQLSGGSAGQSSTIQCFDALLGISHGGEGGAFLARMRDYMPPDHRRLIETIAAGPSLKDFVMSSGRWQLQEAFDSCVTALVKLRNYHLQAVSKFIIVPAADARRRRGCPMGDAGQALEDERGTGGSPLMTFLKGVRDTAKEAKISKQQYDPRAPEM